MSMVINLDKVCIVCLQESHSLRCAYDPFDIETGMTIAEMITSSSQLDLSLVDKIPLKICGACLNDLMATWRFRQNCLMASSLLLSIIQKEEDETSEVSSQLQQQNIKLPSDIKVKRVVQAKRAEFVVPEEKVENEKIEEDGSPSEEKIILEIEDASAMDDDGEQGANESVEYEDYYELEDDDETEQIDSIEGVGVEQEDKSCTMTESDGEGDAREMEIREEYDEEVEEGDREGFAGFKSFEAEDEPDPEPETKRRRGRPRRVVNNENSHRESLSLRRRPKDETLSESEGSPQKLSKTRGKKRKTKKMGIRPPKICDICGNSYKYQHALNAHMRRHNNDRPFPCEFCDKRFVSGVELRRHMRVHTGHKPYACQYCTRRFSDFGSRIKHERTHTGERPYACPSCGKSFAYAHVLTVHLRTHTGEKKFSCSLCGKGFTKKTYLQTHLNSHALLGDFKPELQEEGEQEEEMKSVAGEECIFTTEYIIEEELVGTEPKIEEEEEAA